MENILGIFRSIRAVLRLLHILAVIFKEAAIYLFKPASFSKRLRWNLQKLGPTFVKFGQILSTRSDLLPENIIKELEKLQSNTEPFADKTAQDIIVKVFKKPLNKIFKKFYFPSFASASLGQVYRAILPSGEIAAVKVQRPGAKKIILVDTTVLLWAVKLIEWLFPSLKIYKLREAVKEFKRWTLNELNYTLEAANADIFNQYFEDDPHVYSPKVYWDYTAKQVLTLEYVEGENLKTIIETPGEAQRKKKIAQYGASAFIRQYFEFGFFHADPHPGNCFVTKDDILYFLDFGMVGRLDSHLTEFMGGIFLGLLQRDIEKIVNILIAIHDEYSDSKTVKLQQNQINALRKAGGEVVEQWFGVRDRKHNFTRIFYDLLQAAAKNGFFVPVDVILMSKSIVTLDIVTRQLDPDFDLSKFEEPLIKKLIAKRLDPGRIASEAKDFALVLEKMIATIPSYSSELTKRLSSGRIGMDINPQQIAEYEARLERNSSRRSLATIVAALFIGSALLHQLPDQPHWAGVELSLFGFLLSFVLLLKILLNLKKGEQEI